MGFKKKILKRIDKRKVSKKKEADQYGKTHSVAINQYKPPVKEDY